MKKFLFFVVACLFTCGMHAQSVDWYHVDGSCVIRGGYNFAEKMPFGGVAVIAEFGFLRAQLEVGALGVKTGLERPGVFPYIAPMFGFSTSGRHVVYVLAGTMPIGALYKDGNTTGVVPPVWLPRLEAGVDFRLSDLLFLNVGGTYLIRLKSHPTPFKNAALTVGLGFRL